MPAVRQSHTKLKLRMLNFNLGFLQEHELVSAGRLRVRVGERRRPLRGHSPVLHLRACAAAGLRGARLPGRLQGLLLACSRF